jgi:pimeloyl-ACP methyl ester carboxylesterase
MSIYRTAAGAHAVERRYRELIDGWPVPAEEHVVPTRAGETFVIASGPADAPPVLALPGSGGNTIMWRQQVAVWSEYLRVYAVDVIGEPGLSAPARPPLASGAHADWLDDVLAGLGISEVSLAGVSQGGWLALDYAIRRPQRVTRLAVLAPGGVGRRKVGVLLAAILLRPFGAAGRRRTLRWALGPGARRPTPDTSALADFTLLIFTHFKPRMESIPVFTDDQLRGLTMPVLAVVGSRDALVDSAGTARRLTATVPHATVRVLPDAGHYLPDQTADVLEFLRDRSGVGVRTDRADSSG